MNAAPTVDGILANCAAAYAGCRTYRDTGESTTVFVGVPLPLNRHEQRLVFRTFFQRPDRLFFEYQVTVVGSEERSFVVSNEKGVFEWSTLPIPGLERGSPRTLELALATLTGVSGGAASFVPMLLLPHLQPFPLPSARNVALVGVEEVEGFRCFRIRDHGTNEKGSDWWIDADHGFVRRRMFTRTFDDAQRRKQAQANRALLDTMKLDDPLRVYIAESCALQERPSQDFTSESVVTYSPEFDVEIEPRVFEFHPPGDQVRAIPAP